jgi:hypothetical protein
MTADMVRERLTAAGLVVRPLEWRSRDLESASARTIVGTYVAVENEWWLRESASLANEAASFDAAKAAAQADYEQRILFALILSNSTGEAE